MPLPLYVGRSKQISPLGSRGLGRPGRGALVAFAEFLLGAASPPPDYAPDTLYLLVASWCAPCRTEIARLPALSAAASPKAVRVVAMDASPATTAMLRTVDPAAIVRSARTVNALSQLTGGLPFSVMTDRRGDRCATHARPLDPDAVRAMRARCDRATEHGVDRSGIRAFR